MTIENPKSQPSGWTIDTLKEFIVSKIEENDARYEQRFLSQEKAVAKAEEAQREYNEKSNEFRQALDDANKTNIGRTEVAGMFKSMNEKIDVINNNHERAFDELKKDINFLRESRSSVEGKGLGFSQSWGLLIGVIGLIGAIIGIVAFFNSY